MPLLSRGTNYLSCIWLFGPHVGGPQSLAAPSGCSMIVRICDSLQQSASTSGINPGWCSFPLLQKTNKQQTKTPAQGPVKRYFFLPSVQLILAGEQLLSFTHTQKKLQNKLLQLGRTRDFFRTAIERTVIAASCVRTVIKAQPNTHKRTRVSYNLSSHSLLVVFFFRFWWKEQMV